MRVEGDAPELTEVLFPDGLVPQILNLLVDTWQGFRRPTDDEPEPKITNRYVLALQAERRKRGLRFRVEPHPKDIEHLDETTGRGWVEIDIMVPHGYDSRCYFGIEAKKLNCTTESGKDSRSGAYVGKEGMGCFVDGRYACHQTQGAMVGYVMDSDCAAAKDSVRDSMSRKATELKMSTPCKLEPSRHLPVNPDAFETRHDVRDGFTIHHVLLAA
jgi:hypothetical protein